MILTPDFAHHGWRPLHAATLVDGAVELEWPDGLAWRCHPLWLYDA